VRYKYAVILGGALLVGGTAWPGISGAAFEDIEVSPRTRAMGTTFIAFAPDAYAPFHNPASLAWTLEPEVAASYVQPFGVDFSKQTAATGVLETGKVGGIGVGFRYFGTDYGGQDLTSETTITFAQGFRLLDDDQSTVAIGYALSYYALSYGTSVTGIDPGDDGVFGVNLGAEAVLYQRTKVGVYAQNVNNPSIGDLDKEELIRRVGVGISYQPYPGVLTMLDISNELNDPVQFRGGTEFEVASFLQLRAGLRTQPNIFTAGFGFLLKGVRVDYAFSTGGGTLSSSNQIGIGYAFPSGKKK